MNHVVNPYISGPPVFGEDFYGREEEIRNVLDTKHRLILFLATRRMGKTSLCFQIKHKCEEDVQYGNNICVGWDLQGKRDADSAKRRLFSFKNKIALKNVDWNKLEKYMSCNEVIEGFCESYYRGPEKRTIILMLDEPDILLHFGEKKEYGFLTDLKNTFENVPNLRVIIVSPPRIMTLFQCREIPCLLDDFQTYFVRELNDPDAESLMRLTQRAQPAPIRFLANGSQVVKDIIGVSNRVPFYVQSICARIFDVFPDQSPSEVMENIIDQQVFSPFFTSDFQELHPIQRIMLLVLVNSHEAMEGQALIDETKSIANEVLGKVPTFKYIDELVSLGTLKKYEGSKYHFSNKLFDRWILRDFENLWNETMREIDSSRKYDKKKITPGSLKKKDLEDIRAEWNAFKDVLQELQKNYRDGTVTPEFYYNKEIFLVREQALLIRKLQDHLSSNGASSLWDVLEHIRTKIDEGDAVVEEKLKQAMQDGMNKGWGQIISDIMKNQSMGIVQIALEASFKVAEYLINPDA